jgi:hypothetical protein
MNLKNGMLVVAGMVLLGGVLALTSWTPVQAVEQGGMPTAGPRYTIVETQGSNLLVTDNGTNTVYFYTIDKDKEIGSDLKLRASVDLTQVGKPEIHIKKVSAK